MLPQTLVGFEGKSLFDLGFFLVSRRPLS